MTTNGTNPLIRRQKKVLSHNRETPFDRKIMIKDDRPNLYGDAALQISFIPFSTLSLFKSLNSVT